MSEYVFSTTDNKLFNDSLYESYLAEKINSEDRLAYALKENMVLSESDYSNICALHESNLSNKIKVKWKKFIAFIKNLIAKFMESLTNLLLNEKDYLEKYKNIILKKRPKEDMEYSYTGDYTKGIDRIMNTQVPLFDYTNFKNAFKAEGDKELVEAIMSGKNFNYDDSETLAEQFKNYFLVYDAGQKEGKFSDLNMTDIYNFCYNFNKIKTVVDNDIKRLEGSTRAIESMINKSINSTVDTSTKEESMIYFKEDGNDQDTKNDNTIKKDDKPEGLKIKTSTDFTKNASSTQDRNNDEEKEMAEKNAKDVDDDKAKDITAAADKWISVCRALISAKATACQQIAKDYMDIIRAHVRSYGGQDKKSKEGNKAPDIATQYSKDAEKANKEAENANKQDK